MVQLSDPYMTTGKAIALPGWAFVRNLMSLLSVHCLNDCSHEIKRCLLLRRKAMTNLDRCQVSKWYLWRTGKPGIRQSMGLQRVRHDWVTEQQQPPHMKETVGGKTRSLIETVQNSVCEIEHFQLPHLTVSLFPLSDKSICYPNWNMLFKWFDDLFYHDVYVFFHIKSNSPTQAGYPTI